MTASSILPDPPADLALHPLEQIRRQVAASLFDETQEPSTIGRFQVLRVVGAGGMGVVYAARDPQLDRTVALKLLHPAQLGPVAQQRLLREAQAMARLQHPNVLAVHDAGVHAGQVWIAMEYEAGGTLGDWLRAAPRRWPEVVEVLAQAGRGLAAAHAAGLVHRDFKPANVLVGGGRIRISDFGLARLGEEAAVDFERTADEHSAALAEPITRTGAVLGTPAYMAPELLAGRPASARSDQFAFCVVLYEALHGHRPFGGDDIGQLSEAFQRGAIVRPSTALPRALHAVLERGLAIDPERRYPSMDALLAALARVREARPARRAWAAALTGLSFLFVGSYVYSSEGPTPAPASGPASSGEQVRGDRLGEVWNPERAGALKRALPDAREEVEALVVRLDDYAARWREVRAERAAAGGDGKWTHTCLDDRLHALDDFVTVVSEGTRETAHLVADAAEFLPDVADCAQPSLYNTLTSQGFAATRRAAWRGRMILAGGFVPRALHAVRQAEMGKAFEALFATRVLGDARLDLEIELAIALALYHREPGGYNTHSYRDPRTGERVVYKDYHAPPRESTLESLREVAEKCGAGGFADLAVRAWTAVAELLEAGPHTDGERVATWEALRTELAKLPAAHRLRRRVAVDLAIFGAAHARHAAPAGSCGASDKFGACEVVHRAIEDLAAVLGDEGDPSMQRWLAEQLAQAHEHAGDRAAATAVRAAHPGAPDRRTAGELGYLDFAAGAVTPATPGLAEQVRCTYDHSRCEIDPAYLAGDLDPEKLLDGAWFMPLQEGPEFVGFRVMSRPDNALMRRLDLRDRDRIVAVDGVSVTAPEFMWDSDAAHARGRLRLTLERDDARIERELVLRAP